jgi:hypothetical protein
MSLERRPNFLTRHVSFFDGILAPLTILRYQAQAQEMDIRRSLDDGTQPLLADPDVETQGLRDFSFDLEYVNCFRMLKEDLIQVGSKIRRGNN